MRRNALFAVVALSFILLPLYALGQRAVPEGDAPTATPTGDQPAADGTQAAPADQAAPKDAKKKKATVITKREDLPGSPFVIAAYMVIWGGLFWYLFTIQKRSRKLEDEVAELRRTLAAHDSAKS